MTEPELSLQQIKAIQASILNEIKENREALESIRSLQAPLIQRWQNFIGLMLPLQQKVIQKYLFSDGQEGLSAFNKQLSEHLDDTEIKALNQKKWDIALQAAFGFTNNQPMTLADAQKLIGHMAQALTSDESLAGLDKIAGEFDETCTMLDKRQRALEFILPIQMSVMAEHGFEGEQGYVMAQASLVEHFHDPMISETANKAMHLIFSKLGLIN